MKTFLIVLVFFSTSLALAADATCDRKWLEMKPDLDHTIYMQQQESLLLNECNTSKPFSVSYRGNTTESAKKTRNTAFELWLVCCTR